MLNATNIFGLILALAAVAGAQAGDEDAQLNDQVETAQTQVELFTGPKLINLKAPKYPRREQRLGKEGWVQLHFMIDPEGKPYEVVVTDSTGSEAFERSALNVVKRWTFEPALMDGVPIDAGSNYKIKFSLTGPGGGARSSFIRAVKRLNKSINSDDREGAEAALVALDVQNLYEDAYLNLTKFSYFLRWGSEHQQLNALRRGIAHESHANYLPKKQFASALLSKFVLEVRLQDYARALTTWKKLEAHDIDEQKRAKLQNIVDDLVVLKEDDRSYAVSGQIGANSSWFYRLLKNSFSLDVIKGEVAEIKLRCDKKYVFFRFEPDIQYRIADNYGSCGIELVGNPGTTFSLVQS